MRPAGTLDCTDYLEERRFPQMLRLLRQGRVHHRRCRNRGGTRVMTETALLCGWLERQIRLRRNPPLCFLQPQLPQCDIGRDATFIEKAAPQGSQSDTKPLRLA